MYIVRPFSLHAIALPRRWPVVQSSPSTIRTCAGWRADVPKSPFTPTTAPAADDILLVSVYIG